MNPRVMVSPLLLILAGCTDAVVGPIAPAFPRDAVSVTERVNVGGVALTRGSGAAASAPRR